MKGRKPLSKEQFISKASKVHGNQYNYDFVEYKNNYTKVKIICKKHRVFEQRPGDHLKGQGCPKCSAINIGKAHISNKQEFIEKAAIIHNNKYNYDRVQYKGSHIKVEIGCPIHGPFQQMPWAHLAGAGCPLCGNVSTGQNQILGKAEFVKRAKQIHGNKYDYSKSLYIDATTNITIICPIHGEFEQTPNNHINMKQGCPHCKESKGEKEVRKILDKFNIRYVSQYKFKGCKNKRALPFDFYLPDYNTCIEYNGKQHYLYNGYFGEDSFKLTQETDNIKRNFCSLNNIKLIEIKYDEDVEKAILSELKEMGNGESFIN